MDHATPPRHRRSRPPADGRRPSRGRRPARRRSTVDRTSTTGSPTAGYDYGPAFRGLRAGLAAGRRPVRRGRLPAARPTTRLRVHPALLDAALHVAGLVSRGRRRAVCRSRGRGPRVLGTAPALRVHAGPRRRRTRHASRCADAARAAGGHGRRSGRAGPAHRGATPRGTPLYRRRLDAASSRRRSRAPVVDAEVPRPRCRRGRTPRGQRAGTLPTRPGLARRGPHRRRAGSWSSPGARRRRPTAPTRPCGAWCAPRSPSTPAGSSSLDADGPPTARSSAASPPGSREVAVRDGELLVPRLARLARTAAPDRLGPRRHRADHRRHRRARRAASPGTWSRRTACGTCCWSAGAARTRRARPSSSPSWRPRRRGHGRRLRRRRPRRRSAALLAGIPPTPLTAVVHAAGVLDDGAGRPR